MTTYHGAYGGKSALKVLYNSVMARGQVVIANSQFTRERIEVLHPFAAGRVQVIHRGSDLRRLSPTAVEGRRVQQLRERWGVASDEPIVLLASRLTAWKGHRVLIEAARLLAQKGLTEPRYVLAGDEQGRTAYRAELELLAAQAGLAEAVKIVGHCEDMPAAFLAAAVAVVPSVEPEAFGRVAVEAQAMGLPVIVSDLGAAPETVLAPPDVDPQARTGWRVPAGDPYALAGALQTALSLGASAREALAKRARAHVEEHFSLERMCADTLALYARLLGA